MEMLSFKRKLFHPLCNVFKMSVLGKRNPAHNPVNIEHKAKQSRTLSTSMYYYSGNPKNDVRQNNYSYTLLLVINAL